MADEHEGTPITTKTPLYTLDWYIKWIASLVLMFGMILTANNVYPANLFFHFVGIGGWLIVGMMWNDRALMVINTFALATLATSITRLYLDNNPSYFCLDCIFLYLSGSAYFFCYLLILLLFFL